MLPVAAHPAQAEDREAFNPTVWAEMITIVVAPDRREHVVFSDGYRHIRIDVVQGTLRDRSVRLHYLLSGIEGLDPRILTLRRLVSLLRTGGFARKHHPPERLARRWIAALRAHDAVCAGASQRDIAAALFGANDITVDWRKGSDFLRLRVQRLLRVGRHMTQGGYRALLP